MLFTRIILPNIKSRIIILPQSLRTSIKLYSSSSETPPFNSSDSSDSSDSDTETKTVKRAAQQNESKTEVEEKSLGNMLDELVKKKVGTPSKQVDVAVTAKKSIKKAYTKQNNVPYAVQLTRAAENVAQHLGQNETPVKSQLLNRLIKTYNAVENGSTKAKETFTPTVLKDLLSNMKIQTQHKKTKEWKSKASIASTLTLSSQKPLKSEAKVTRLSQIVPLFQKKPIGIFNNMNEPVADIPELTTWKALEQRELDLLLLQSPQNIFQEMIQWTNEGKLWKFPIDNEIGLEEEHSVHFSEHVFLERHLKDWCPKRGPVRHFMELVCVGLSKNPFMTVGEKVGHINWYKEYFKDKEDLLQELGAVDTPTSNKPKEVKE